MKCTKTVFRSVSKLSLNLNYWKCGFLNGSWILSFVHGSRYFPLKSCVLDVCGLCDCLKSSHNALFSCRYFRFVWGPVAVIAYVVLTIIILEFNFCFFRCLTQSVDYGILSISRGIFVTLKKTDLFTAFPSLSHCTRCILVDSVLDVTCPFRIKSHMFLAI